MKKLLFLLSAAVAAMSISAAPVDQFTASKWAAGFMNSTHHRGAMMAPMTGKLELKKAEASRVKGAGAVYYIYTTSNSYVIVAGDDRAETILAYGDYELDVNNMAPGMRDLLGQYQDAIEYLQQNPNLKVDPIVSPRNTPSLKATSVGPLLTALWDQTAPFWNECYFGSYQCYTGCPATSAAMVLYYWKYPTDPVPALPAYESEIEYSYWGSTSYTHSALPSVTFDWDNMIDDYTGSYTTAQGAAVAQLMHYVGHAEHMIYGTSSAGGSGISVDSVQNIADMFILFGYDPETVRMVQKTSAYSGGTTLYNDAEWAAIIQEEMLAERPVVFCAVSSGGGGHAFNVDGYDSSTNKYHINFGWSGEDNDWCALNAFGGYNVFQQMVIGIQPPVQGPSIKVNPASVEMTAYVEKSATATFTVKGNELTSAIALSLNDPSGCFAIDATSVPVSDQENGKVITVTYAPQAVGTHTATVTLTNADAEEKVVTITGTATLETYKPEMLAANETYINLTKFRADWTDATPAKNVESYTLEVSTRPSVELLDSLNGNNYPGSYESITLTEPWSGSGVKVGNSAYYFSNSSGSGYMSFTVPDGYENAEFTMQITTVSGTYGRGNLTVRSEQTDAVGHTFVSGETYNWIVVASSGEKITITSTDSYYSPDMNMIKVYAGNVNELNTLRAVAEEGDANYRLVTGITDKFYTVRDLEAAGTFYYKVKAVYTDGTTSPWSNTEKVTLFENGHEYDPGDVNHDGVVNITDVTMLVAHVMDETSNTICEICADVNGDGVINVTDVTILIGMAMGN